MSITIDQFTARELRLLPVPSLSEGTTPPDHSEIHKVAETVLGGLKYSFAALAADPGVAATAAAGSVEAEMAAALAAFPKERLTAYAATARELLAAKPRTRAAIFGPVGELDPAKYLGAGGFTTLAETARLPELDATLLGVDPDVARIPLEKITTRGDDLVVSGLAPLAKEALTERLTTPRRALDPDLHSSRLDDIWGERLEVDPFAGGVAEEHYEPYATTDKLGLWITQIKCVDETNPEWPGDDEIALAGVEVDEDGDTKKIGEKFIGSGFRDGTTRSYANWRYTWFSLGEGKYWPKRYSVTFILAEKDHGGLQSFLDKIWQQVRDQVKAAIAKAVGGVASAYLGPVIGNAIGQAVAWVVDVFVGWIISLFGDDIFPLRTVSVTTPSAAARWYYPNGTWGNPSSPVRTVNFYGHGGHYQLRYHWKFHS